LLYPCGGMEGGGRRCDHDRRIAVGRLMRAAIRAPNQTPPAVDHLPALSSRRRLRQEPMSLVLADAAKDVG
jgi:hypothetical protein